MVERVIAARHPATERGQGSLVVDLVDGASAAVGWRATDPLKLMLPKPRGPAVWACAATYGGGLVAGDRIALDIEVGAGASLFIGTQSTTKVFRSTGAEAVMRSNARIATGGLLAALPEPVSCFADSRYRQESELELAEGASLAWLDAVSAGRIACGESWRLASCRTLTSLRLAGRLVARDAMRLDAEVSTLGARLAGIASLASLFLIGPRCAAAVVAVQAVVQAHPPGQDGLWLTASPFADGCLLRGAATTHDILAGRLRQAMQPLAEQLGGDPWRRLASVELPCI